MTKQQLQIRLDDTKIELMHANQRIARLDASWAACIESLQRVQCERDALYKVRDIALQEVAFYKRMADYLLDRGKT